MSIEKGTINLVMVFDHEALIKKKERRIKRLYKLCPDGIHVSEVDVEMLIKTLVEKTKEGIKVEELLKEAFIKTSPDLLLEAYKRILVMKKKPIAGASSSGNYRHCCYSLIVPGEKGQKKIEIVLNK